MQITPQQMRERLWGLMAKARTAAKKTIEDKTELAEDKIDEILTEGNFYGALADIMVDIPLFPYAVLKGPTVRMVFEVDWATGTSRHATVNQSCGGSGSRPFDVYWTPGAADIEDAAIIERTRLTRTDLNDLLDVDGYDVAAIRVVLDNYGRAGLSMEWDMAESPRAQLESREDPWFNQSHMISCLQYTGNVQGRMLIEYGFTDARHSRSAARLRHRGMDDRPVPDQGAAEREPAPSPQVLHLQLGEGAGHAAGQRHTRSDL